MRELNMKEAERLWTSTKGDLNVWVDANLT
jgi:hypothetical protein